MTVKAILTDIEGTTSSISFVKNVLFPYAAKHIGSFVRENSDEPAVQAQLVAVAQACDCAADDLDSIVEQLQQWIKADEKVTALKTLQGMLWKHGYESGAYQAHIYPDAYSQMQQWHEQGLPLFVYSSGSIAAQQLFFQYSAYADVRHLFKGFFDTTFGSKKESASYERIVRTMRALEPELDADNVLFLSDVVQELDAAKQAGLKTCAILRAGDSVYRDSEDAGEHPSANHFDAVQSSISETIEC